MFQDVFPKQDSRVQSTRSTTDILSPITSMMEIAGFPQVCPKIVHSMLGDLIEKIAPDVLNEIIGSLNNPGFTITPPESREQGIVNYKH